MGSNNLSTKSPGDVIASEDPNQYKAAADGNLVPRDTGGIPTNLAGSLGESLLRWFRLFIDKITVGDPDDEVHIEQTGGTLTIKTNDIVKFSMDADGFNGNLMAVATRMKLNIEEFTADGTFDVPEGIETIMYKAVGGGGGGAGGQGGGNAGGGGQGVKVATGIMEVTPSAPIIVTVGLGGAPGSVTANGSAGGDSEIDGVVVSKGGSGGIHNGGGNSGTATIYSGGAPGGVGHDSENFEGGSASPANGGGGGGASSFGDGGDAGVTSPGSQAQAGQGAGAGGGGAPANVSFQTGGAGANGKVIIMWFDHPSTP